MPLRLCALAGLTAGLALAPVLPGVAPAEPLVVGIAALVALAGVRRRPPSIGWLACLAAACSFAGAGVGLARVNAIDAGAFAGPAGVQATIRGYVAAVPKRSEGTVRVRVDTSEGRILVNASEPVPDLPVGREVEVTGTVRDPADWETAYLARLGIHRVLEAKHIALTGGRRAGPMRLVDDIRDRAEAALGEGTPAPEAALLRGFVLGEDDRIDPGTVDDFKRSGLAHLLAVSGENVMLLGLLAAPLLGLAGVPLRARLLVILGLIAVYVPVTGAGPSIQRAGIMGAAGVVAALAGRPRSRWYAVALAAFGTLLLNPRATGDPSWQLSFAAVVGILLWAGTIRDLVAGEAPSSARRALAEGAGVTIAATLATAPLFASEFGAVSPASLPANLLALPAVAPMMWLGMLASICGQLPGFPVAPLTALAGLLAAYVAQVAHATGAPSWARVDVGLPGPFWVAVAYAALGLLMVLLRSWAHRRAGSLRPRRVLIASAVLAALVAIAWQPGSRPPDRGGRPGLRVVVEDVGQGDSILLDPRGGPPILVDAGPPGDGISTTLRSQGVSRLGAVMVTHDQSDHAGGIGDLLGAMPVHRILYAARPTDVLAAARAAGVEGLSVSEGSEVDSGALRLEVLWPPRSSLDAAPPSQDPNLLCIVALARWHGFTMLLTGDAEAESTPIDLGPVDVLKVAHHGSDDAGLGALLDRIVPRLAVISVGSGNPYGHPTPGTLATLAEHRVPVLRTDEDGDVRIDVGRYGFAVTG